METNSYKSIRNVRSLYRIIKKKNIAEQREERPKWLKRKLKKKTTTTIKKKKKKGELRTWEIKKKKDI